MSLKEERASRDRRSLPSSRPPNLAGSAVRGKRRYGARRWAARLERAAEDARRQVNPLGSPPPAAYQGLCRPGTPRFGAGHRASGPGAAGRGRGGQAGACSDYARLGRASKRELFPGVRRQFRSPRPARLGCDPEHLGGASARRLLPCPQLPQRPTSQLPFISLFWWRKAGLSILETKIFPGSLYLLIFQFLAAALSAGGGGRAKFNAAGEGAAARSRLFSAGLRRQGRAAAPGPPDPPCSLRERPELPPGGPAGALGSNALSGREAGCDETESEGRN